MTDPTDDTPPPPPNPENEPWRPVWGPPTMTPFGPGQVAPLPAHGNVIKIQKKAVQARGMFAPDPLEGEFLILDIQVEPMPTMMRFNSGPSPFADAQVTDIVTTVVQGLSMIHQELFYRG